MKLRPFEYLVLLHPEDKSKEDTKIIVGKQFIMSKDDRTAAMAATRKIPTDFDNQLDQVEIIVRPF